MRPGVKATLSIACVLALLALILTSTRSHRVSSQKAIALEAAKKRTIQNGPTAGPHFPNVLPANARIPMIDMHVHLSRGGVARLAQLMPKYGFDHIINLSGGAPGGILEDQLLAALSLPGRITTFTTLDYKQASFPNYGERMAAAVRTAHQLGAKGLKIAKVLGLALTDPEGHLIAVDDPKLDPVFEAAGELDMPIAIHTGDPRAFWQPVDDKNERADELRAHPGWSLFGVPVPSFDQMLTQLEHRIARHPHTKFISVHFGNCAEDPDYVTRM
ncbi:MAG TPA: amidohydrolase family protein, partial [Polyangiaceae bacterium]|nr:amidohydrolase family protein [Polyangiaceae bacterium]